MCGGNFWEIQKLRRNRRHCSWASRILYHTEYVLKNVAINADIHLAVLKIDSGYLETMITSITDVPALHDELYVCARYMYFEFSL